MIQSYDHIKFFLATFFDLDEVPDTLISPEFLELSDKVECLYQILDEDEVTEEFGADPNTFCVYRVRLCYKDKYYEFYEGCEKIQDANGEMVPYYAPSSYCMLMKLIYYGNMGAMSYKRYCEKNNYDPSDPEYREQHEQCKSFKYAIQQLLEDDYMLFVKTALKPIY